MGSDKPREVQKHHRSYDPEVIDRVFKGEHMILTKMGWISKKSVSWGFLRCLLDFVVDNMDRAIELE